MEMDPSTIHMDTSPKISITEVHFHTENGRFHNFYSLILCNKYHIQLITPNSKYGV